MSDEEVRQLGNSGDYNGVPIHGRSESTHISWVILTEDFAFKIKKPVKLPFLDFSTLALRKFYCEREVELNGRYSNIYLACEPIAEINGRLQIGEHGGTIVDYCVVMKRMNSDKRLDVMLQRGFVEPVQIRKLGHTVARFHKSATKVFIPFDLQRAKETFNDILSIRSVVHKKLSTEFADLCSESVQWSNAFLESHQSRFAQRIREGWQRDVHGDLHTRNIFIYDDPVLFDCIEFNNAFRQIDVLYEIAFLCMDFEAGGNADLSEVFISAYSEHLPLFRSPEDERLLNYFKALRANVRAKVHAISTSQSEPGDDHTDHVREGANYLRLLAEYMH